LLPTYAYIYTCLLRATFLTKSIAAANCTSLAITAEPASELSATVSSTGYTGETVVDPENVLVKELKQRGLLNVVISDHKGYKHLMAQPAVLVLGEDETVLYSCAIVLSMVREFLNSLFFGHDEYGADLTKYCR
jgi:hypothetical protein